MTDEAKLLEAKSDLLRSVSALIEEFYTAPGVSAAFDWTVTIARLGGEYVVRVQAGDEPTPAKPHGPLIYSIPKGG